MTYFVSCMMWIIVIGTLMHKKVMKIVMSLLGASERFLLRVGDVVGHDAPRGVVARPVTALMQVMKGTCLLRIDIFAETVESIGK